MRNSHRAALAALAAALEERVPIMRREVLRAFRDAVVDAGGPER